MKPIFLKNGEGIIRGAFHVPPNISNKVPGILIIPGFADTAVGPHNMHIQITSSLVQKGYAVLRFDYRGQGESEGDFTEFTLKSGSSDARTALNTLLQYEEIDTNRIGIIGYSLGGTYAIELAAEFNNVRTLGLLAPVAYPHKVFISFFQSDHFDQAEKYGWIDWLGWQVGRKFLSSLNDLDPITSIEKTKASIILFHGTEDAEVPIENAAAFSRKGAKVEWIKGGDHGFSSVKIKDEVIIKLCDWFQFYLNDQGGYYEQT